MWKELNSCCRDRNKEFEFCAEEYLGKQPVAFCPWSCDQGQQSSRKHRENLTASEPEVFQERVQSWRKQNLSASLGLEKPSLSFISAQLGAQTNVSQAHFPAQGDPIPTSVTYSMERVTSLVLLPTHHPCVSQDWFQGWGGLLASSPRESGW